MLAPIWQLLLLWSERYGHFAAGGLRVPLNMTRQALGDKIGATRETVNRLPSVSRKDWIRITGGSVLLLDPEELHSVGFNSWALRRNLTNRCESVVWAEATKSDVAGGEL